MNITKKIEKELLFKTNIKEITSISLDSDHKIEGNELIGTFLINGEYKIHEISINREKFNFKIPFKVSLENNIDLNTVKLEITNFEYDYKKDELLVNIEYVINGDRIDVLTFEDEESLEEFLNNKEVEVIDTRLDDIKENIKLEMENEVVKEETNKELVKEEIKNEEQIKEIYKEEIIDERNNVNSDDIINYVDKNNEKFITYQIYQIKENDTLESIVLKYKITLEELKEYNDLNNIKINDKLIIPYNE